MAPVASIPPVYKRWVLWLAAAVAVLTAKPWGAFGWDEWLAIAAPLLLINPALRRVDVFAIGLVATVLAWFLLSDPSGGWLELACHVVILVIGTLVAYNALRGGTDRVVSAGVVNGLASEQTLFLATLDRELCRARRDQVAFAVLSLDLKGDPGAAALDSVREFLDAELRAYADFARVEDRILGLVPGVVDGQARPLRRRLLNKWEATREGELRIGVARFPQDAICAQDLIELADRKRLVSGIAPAVVESQQPQAAPAEGRVSM